MTDMPGRGRPQQDNDQLRHTLSVHDVSEQLSTAGVPRSDRQIKRYCQAGFFDAVKVPGPTGDQWYVAPASIPKVIGDLKQWQAQSGTRPTTSDPVPLEKSLIVDTDTSGHGRPHQALSDKKSEENRESGEPVTSTYVLQLEKRIEEKDETIKFLQEELVDRRAQIGGMKAIIDGQRQLLETINNNVAPVFGALAQLVQGKKEGAGDTVHATVVDQDKRGVESEQL